MAVSAGKLRHRVRIETVTISRDSDYGDVTETWALLARNGIVWADIQPLSGQERWQANAADPEMTHTITIRYHDTIGPKDRIVYGSRTFRIQSVMNVGERNDMMDITAVEEI
tara:strand:- start:204 stop:539 length:336 start_codon:yes stop_codon:yes gene_type:complete